MRPPTKPVPDAKAHSAEAEPARHQKVYRTGTHRAVTPSRTVARLKPLLPALGITRLANITGLDVIGIPVFMAVRPNSRSLAVFQGKGVDADSARASAMMEAIETQHAETIEAPLKLASVEELAYTHLIADISRLPFSAQDGFDPFRPFLWIEGDDLLSGGRKWLPFELVHANYTVEPMPGDGSFVATTNGLASGNVLEEAICHGLFEVIERDATTLWKLGGEQAREATAVDPASIADPVCRALLEKFSAADIDIAIWDATSDIGIATFQCLAAGRDDANGAPEMGAGTHLNREVALARALTEAAQARTTYISGARDDITAEHYSPDARTSRQAAARALIAAHAPACDFADVPTFSGESFEADIEQTLGALLKAGIEEVLAIDLTKPAFGIPVVRIVVPGLEALLESDEADYVPGERAARLMQGEPA